MAKQLLPAVFAALLVCAASTAAANGLPQRRSMQAITDTDILNFALNLEYLEAQFYHCAAYGVPINSTLWGGGPAPLNCTKALLSMEAQMYAEAIAQDELNHVIFLRTALGTAAVPQPQLDLGNAFVNAANAALNTTLSPAFSAYGSDILFYHAAFIFEDVGVTAYKGALSSISNKEYLTVAGGILAVEAYHGGSIRTLLLQQVDVTVFPYGAKVAQIIQAISSLRAAVSGGNNDMGILSAMGDYIVAPADANSVAFSRTPQQVLNIVYLGGKGKGGFFPDGLKGNIK